MSSLVVFAATWLGRVTVFANHFPNPMWMDGMDRKLKFLRDSQGAQVRPKTLPTKRKSAAVAIVPARPGDLSACPRWAALRARILAKTSAQSDQPFAV